VSLYDENVKHKVERAKMEELFLVCLNDHEISPHSLFWYVCCVCHLEWRCPQITYRRVATKFLVKVSNTDSLLGTYFHMKTFRRSTALYSDLSPEVLNFLSRLLEYLINSNLKSAACLDSIGALQTRLEVQGLENQKTERNYRRNFFDEPDTGTIVPWNTLRIFL